MKLAGLFSGGEDSVYALFKALERGDEIVCLIAMISKNQSSYMFHTPNIDLTSLQAKAINIPLIQKPTEGVKEEELKDLKEAIKNAKEEYKFEGIVTGAFASVYQKERIENICNELDLECFNPLWGEDPEKLMREMIDKGFKFILSSIAAIVNTRSLMVRNSICIPTNSS